MEKDIHFVASYVCLQKFLTLYDKNVDNVVVCSCNADLRFFLEELLRGTSHSILSVDSGSNSEFCKFRSYYAAKNTISDNLKLFSGARKIYFYNNTHVLNYFVMIRLLDSGCDVCYVESSLYSVDEGLSGLRDFFYSVVFKLASIHCGISLKLRKVEGKYRPLLLHNYDFVDLECLSWEAIKKKYGFSGCVLISGDIGQKKVLYVHQNFFGNGRGIDRQKTTKNILNFFSKMKNDGGLVFLKNHPNSEEDELFSKLCEIFGDEYVIPDYIPVEMLGDDFNEIYTYFSSGVKKFLSRGSCYTLYNLIVFTKPDKAVNDFISDNLNGIKYVK